jgi:hypothetical protein
MVWSEEPRERGPGALVWLDDATLRVPRMELDDRLNLKQTGMMTVRCVEGTCTTLGD